MKTLWMSDLHFVHKGAVLGHDPRIRLRAAIAHINAHHGDAEMCLISGDLVDVATIQNYRALREALDTLAMPYWPMTGNHDDRGLMRDALPLPEGTMPDFVQYTIAVSGALIVCLDTLLPGADAGEMCTARLAWLEAVLREAGDRSVLLFLHHPPMTLGLPMLDPDNLTDGAALLDLLERYPCVTHLFCGHVHRPITGTVRGMPFATMRSVLYQAPPPRPAWDWSTFQPAPEAPALGVLHIANGNVTLQYDQFCPYAVGVPGQSG